ncbi:pilus assembly protein TadG-related protein [Methylotenera versatilis]|uniref:pilus assembly protein TadG-related protein n=1 Tax=Methylotenera versatilis TaxID=1055487 RepID=UPI000646ACF3|nr:pilus assembly protein TadG-related protein [Methylotenera versatilis]
MRAKSNRHFQRGAIGILGALTLLLLVIFTALVIDSTRLWMVKRQLQTVADMSAIEAARGLGGCSPSLGDVFTRANQAALANGYTENLANAPNIVEMGSVSTVAGRRHFTADGSARAVHVKVTKKVPASLIAKGVFGNDVTLFAEAVSLPNASIAAFNIGTTALTLNTEDSLLLDGLLSGLLGSTIKLDLVSYQGLANTNITLADLIKVEGSVLSVDELLDTQFSAGQLLTLVSEAVKLPENAVPDLVNVALSKLVVGAAHNTQISLGQLLNVNQNSQAEALNAKLNVLNLVNMIASVSNGQNAVTIPLAVNLPGLVSVNAIVNVIEPAQMAIGPPPAVENAEACTFAKTAQVRVGVAVLVNVLGLAKVDLALNVQAANGSAALRSIKGSNTTTDIAFETNTSLLTTSLTNTAGSGPARISLLAGLVPLADIGLNIPQPSSTARTSIMQIERPVKDHLPQTLTVNGSLSNTFEQLFSQPGALKVELLGGALDLLGVLTALVNEVVSTVVAPLLTSISKLLLDPLLKILGISIANMDVTVDDVILTNSGSLVI